MSRITGIIVAVAVLMTGTSFSQEASQLISLALLIANPQNYAGRTVLVHGFIDQSDPATGSFKLIEGKTPSAAKSNVAALLATRSKGDQLSLLRNGQEAIVAGQIQVRDKAAILQVANIITDQATIRRFIRPSERSPRPGDNLGHDAQPSDSISQ
jgi:hypothetical protein